MTNRLELVANQTLGSKLSAEMLGKTSNNKMRLFLVGLVDNLSNPIESTERGLKVSKELLNAPTKFTLEINIIFQTSIFGGSTLVLWWSVYILSSLA